MSEIAIRVENLSKQYRLGEIGTGTLIADLDRWWHKLRGKDDPYLKIGESNDRTKKGESEYVWALKDINFEVKKGEVLGIIGKNGAGKSTLLKILSSTTSPTTGKVKINGKIASLLEVGTGFHPDLSGRDNIYLNGAILGMNKREIKSKFDEIVDFAGVERYIDTPVKRYSSGMYVRLAFGVAAYLEPDILIVDEVLAVGDSEFQKKCLGKMKDVSVNEGRTVIIVSHNLGTIFQLCDRGLLLGNGNLLGNDKPKTVIDYYIKNLNNEKNKIGYNVNESLKKKEKNYIIGCFTSYKNAPCKDFNFEESIEVNFQFHLSEKKTSLLFGIGLLDKTFNRIATVVKSADSFSINNNGVYFGKVIFQSSLLAPNNYSFVIALWFNTGKIEDIVEDICPIKVHDSGTSMSDFEGIDYGNIIIPCSWTD